MIVERLPRSDQRALALGLAAAALLLAIIGVVMPLASAFSDRVARIERLAVQLGAHQRIVASRAEFERRLAQNADEAGLSALVFERGAPAQNIARVQNAIRSAVERTGVAIDLIETLETDAPAPLEAVTIRIRFNATHRQLENAVSRIEAAQPLLFIEQADIRAISPAASTRQELALVPVLLVELNVVGFLQPVAR